MKPTSPSLVTLIKTLACAVLVLGFTVQAADKPADPTGKWSWSRPGRDGGAERTITLTLKADGENLTGKMSSPGRQGDNARETEIQMGKVNGNEISFVIIREFNDNKFVTKYKAKIEGDEMKGTMTYERGGESRDREWMAKRAK